METGRGEIAAIFPRCVVRAQVLLKAREQVVLGMYVHTYTVHSMYIRIHSMTQLVRPAKRAEHGMVSNKSTGR